MSQRILRTAVGSPVAPFLLKQLKKHDHYIVGTDIDKFACGFMFVDKSVVIPRVDDPNYLDIILALCTQEKITIFWPDLDEELLLISENISKFDAIGVKVLLSDKEAIAICSDKWQTYLSLRSNNVPVPLTWDLDTENSIDTFPLILKPKQGRGSMGIITVNNNVELQNFSKPGYVAQEKLTGKEFTIDVLNDFEGNYIYSSIRERVATDSGISTKGVTVADYEITNYVKIVAQALGLKGPTCFQCFKDDKGSIGFIEINPRIAGSIVLSELAGAPFIADSVEVVIGNKVTKPMNYKVGVRMSRYWEQSITED